MAASAVGVLGYTRYVEPEWLEITHHDLPIRNLPTSLVGKRLVQLSDIHVGPNVNDGYVLETFRRVSTLKPDLVMYTGDFTSLHKGMYEHAERAYSEMPKGALGTFASLGNHDYGYNWSHPEDASRMAAILRNLGASVLVNEIAVVNGLQVVGMGDLWGGAFRPEQALAKLAPDAPMIAMSHNPDTVDADTWRPFRGWILSGHTHGGQCKPPFLPPPMLPVRNKRYTSGEFALNNQRRMYISRGVGTVLPVRFNVRPEVTVFTLTLDESA